MNTRYWLHTVSSGVAKTTQKNTDDDDDARLSHRVLGSVGEGKRRQHSESGSLDHLAREEYRY